MAYPGRLLNEGEEVVVDVRAHPWVLARPVGLAVLAVLAAAIGALLRVPAAAAWALVALVAAALANLVARWLTWRATSLVVTTERLVRRSGLLSREGREIPLAALSDISYRQSLFERMIGAGDLLLQSAGRDSTEVVADVPRPAAVHNEIYRLLAERRRGPTGGGRGLSLPEQLDLLDGLRRRGVLSDAEFEATKARLLGPP